VRRPAGGYGRNCEPGRRLGTPRTDWIAWARAPDHDAFWDGTWPTLLEIMPASAGPVLDLGCGEGRAGRQLLAAGRRVLGIERSATLARAAATGSPPLPVAQADAASLPLADGCAALVVASMSLLDIDDVEGAIAETARVLRPGGVFCFAIVHPFYSACESAAASCRSYWRSANGPAAAPSRQGRNCRPPGHGLQIAPSAAGHAISAVIYVVTQSGRGGLDGSEEGDLRAYGQRGPACYPGRFGERSSGCDGRPSGEQVAQLDDPDPGPVAGR
jgi:SAM-dependent methyltransferase